MTQIEAALARMEVRNQRRLDGSGLSEFKSKQDIPKLIAALRRALEWFDNVKDSLPTAGTGAVQDIEQILSKL